jgi:hypothetical protein
LGLKQTAAAHAVLPCGILAEIFLVLAGQTSYYDKMADIIGAWLCILPE